MSEDKSVQDTLMELILQMDERQQRLFACDCAERVLPIWDHKRSDGMKLRAALQVARDFAIGTATNADLGDARARVEGMFRAFTARHRESVVAKIVSFTVARYHSDVLWPDEGW